jgi:YidC/Oxa1 family membrane protein insertase
MDFFKILAPIEWGVAWIMYLAHSAFTWIGLDPASGAAWGLSVVALVTIVRIILIPLFFKQIHAQRGMQKLTPEMQVIQKKYKGKSEKPSREAMRRETMALYKKHGTNPMSSCLPLLAQAPIFFALFQVLRGLSQIASGAQSPIGPIDRAVAAQAETSQIFGAPLSATFTSAGLDPALATSTRVVTIALIVAMAATMFLTQRQLTMKNMPAAALVGQAAQTQKVLLYVMPLVVGISGIGLPIGVLLYMTTTNIWSMGQQFYTIRRLPTPGSQADGQMKARKGIVDDAGTGSVEETVVTGTPPNGQRRQPVRKDRARREPRDLDGARSVARTTQPEATHTTSGAKKSPRVAKSPGEPEVPGTPTTGGPAAGARRKRAGRPDVTAKPRGDAPADSIGKPQEATSGVRRHKTQPLRFPEAQGTPDAIS